MSAAEFDRPPDGHTPTGRPYWRFEKKNGEEYRILGPWPKWPGIDVDKAGNQ